jgi:hypothetical protein
VGTRVLDLSVTGMLLETEMPILTGEELIVSFKSPADDRWFDCEANVARVVHGRRRSDARRALGISFETIDPFSGLLLCEHLRNAPLARDGAARPRASSLGRGEPQAPDVFVFEGSRSSPRAPHAGLTP